MPSTSSACSAAYRRADAAERDAGQPDLPPFGAQRRHEILVQPHHHRAIAVIAHVGIHREQVRREAGLAGDPAEVVAHEVARAVPGARQEQDGARWRRFSVHGSHRERGHRRRGRAAEGRQAAARAESREHEGEDR